MRKVVIQVFSQDGDLDRHERRGHAGQQPSGTSPSTGNVVIRSSDGLEMRTATLGWDNERRTLATDDAVEIQPGRHDDHRTGARRPHAGGDGRPQPERPGRHHGPHEVEPRSLPEEQVMRSAALVLTVLVALGATVVPAGRPDQGSHARAPRAGGSAPAAARARPQAGGRGEVRPRGRSAPGRTPRSSSTRTGWRPSSRDGLVVFTGNVSPSRRTPSRTRTGWRSTSTTRATGSSASSRPATSRSSPRTAAPGTARRAEYYDDDQRLVLIGDARVWQEDNVVTGERIAMFLADDRSDGARPARRTA